MQVENATWKLQNQFEKFQNFFAFLIKPILILFAANSMRKLSVTMEQKIFFPGKYFSTKSRSDCPVGMKWLSLGLGQLFGVLKNDLFLQNG